MLRTEFSEDLGMGYRSPVLDVVYSRLNRGDLFGRDVTAAIVILEGILIGHQGVGYCDRGSHARLSPHPLQTRELLLISFNCDRVRLHPTLPSRLTATSF